MRTASVPVTITAYTDDSQPGWVEGYVVYADARRWFFHPQKQVYVSRPYLDADTEYPVAGATDCRVVEVENGVATVELLKIGLMEREENYPPIRVPEAILKYYAETESNVAVNEAGVADNKVAFEAWCEKPWKVLSDWAVVPCAVHVSPTCFEQARTAYTEKGDVLFHVCHNIAASYDDELKAKYRVGQVEHTLTGPMQGSWHILLYLDMLYLDDREHPVPTRLRKCVPDPE